MDWLGEIVTGDTETTEKYKRLLITAGASAPVPEPSTRRCNRRVHHRVTASIQLLPYTIILCNGAPVEIIEIARTP
jgi:hypothetical protein